MNQPSDRLVRAAVFSGAIWLVGGLTVPADAQQLLSAEPTEGVYLVCISESGFRDYRAFMDSQIAEPFDAAAVEAYHNRSCINTDAPLYPIRVVLRAEAWVYDANQSGAYDCPAWKSANGKCDVTLRQRTYVLAVIRDPKNPNQARYVVAEMAGGLEIEGGE